VPASKRFRLRIPKAEFVKQPRHAFVRIVAYGFLDKLHVLTDVLIERFHFRQLEAGQQRHFLLGMVVRVVLGGRMRYRIAGLLAILDDSVGGLESRQIDGRPSLYLGNYPWI